MSVTSLSGIRSVTVSVAALSEIQSANALATALSGIRSATTLVATSLSVMMRIRSAPAAWCQVTVAGIVGVVKIV